MNESNMPLLGEDVEKSGETPEKEQIEMTEGEEKKDDSTEKGKKKKEKKEKKPKEKKERGPNCIEVISKDLNLANRDGNDINNEINLSFDDVLAEPASAQGFEGVWKLAFVLFSQTKLWLYRLFAAVLAIPAAFVWALVFAVITVVYVWVASPALRIFDLATTVFRRIVTGLMRCTLEPVCTALGFVFSKMSVSQERRILQEA